MGVAVAAITAAAGVGFSVLAAYLNSRRVKAAAEMPSEAELQARVVNLNSEIMASAAKAIQVAPLSQPQINTIDAAVLKELREIRRQIAAEGKSSKFLSFSVGALYFLGGSAVSVAVTLFVHPLT